MGLWFLSWTLRRCCRMDALKATSALLVLAVFLWSSPAMSVWSHDPTENNVVCDMPGMHYGLNTVSDGGGGAVLIWQDWRDFPDADVYAQRIDASGNLVWPAEGLPVCTLSAFAGNPDIDRDGQGGFVVAWDDDRSMPGRKEIYAQRITIDGAALWGPGGVALSTSEDYNQVPIAVGDGSGGIYAVWGEEINYAARDEGVIYAGNALHAQHAGSTGDTLWGPGGIVVSGAGEFVMERCAASDGQGGLLVVWTAGGTAFAQRFNPEGEPQWTPGNVTVIEPPEPIFWVAVVSDGSGGAIVVLQTDYSGSSDIYAQRIDVWGNIRWTTAGVAVCLADGEQSQPVVASDGSGGAHIAWVDRRGGYYPDIYAQHVDALGQVVWAADGIQISTAPDEDDSPEVQADGVGGAVIAWQSGLLSYSDIRAQRVDASGNLLWPGGGVMVSAAPGDQRSPHLATDGAGGVVVAWLDARIESLTCIYAQRVERNGFLGYPAAYLESVTDYPADQGGQVIITWDPSYLDVWPECAVDYYSVWRRYPDPDILGSARPAARQFLDVTSLSQLQASGWIYTGEVEAWQLPGYSFVVPTFGDSTGSGIPWTECMVLAHNTALDDFWMSGSLAGYSVDNLAPGAPLSLAAEAVGSDAVLTWTASGYHDEDLHHYNVHRSDVPGFVPGARTFAGTAADTFFVDADPGFRTWYYKVIAEDVHGNEGEPSNEASVDVGAGVEHPVMPEALAILGASPNPFRTSATIAFGLPETARISLSIFSVDGRRVAVLAESVVEAGYGHVSWSGSDDTGAPLPSGVYFVRLEAGSKSTMYKVVLLR
jgi:hypothetical protein